MDRPIHSNDHALAHDTEKTTSTSSHSLEGLEAHAGVQTVETAQKVYGRYSKWFLFVSLGLAAYVYSLDGTTTWNYLAFATSAFKDHSTISTIAVAQSVIISCGKPVIAKVADVGSRGTAYFAVLVFYVIGYIIIASAKNIGTVGGGIIIYAVGYTGLQLLQEIVIADNSTLKWRGVVSSLMTTPFIINAFVGSNVAANVLKGVGWRWGYGMFAILVPAALTPLIVTLLWAEHKARRIRKTEISAPVQKLPFGRRAWNVIEKLDVLGLLLLAASVCLILLPLTLAKKARNGWHNPSIIAMVVIGCLLVPTFAFYEAKVAKYPVVPGRFLRNRSVVIASLIGFFDFVSFYITSVYLYSFVIVVKDWSLLNSTYFSQTQTVALCVFGFTAGLVQRFIHRAKPMLVIGLAIRLLGCGLMIHSRGANASDVEIVWSQILQGMGGGFTAVANQVSAQASVPHVDVAMVTAVVLLVTEIGGAIGNAIAGAIWTSLMPQKMTKHLSFLSDAQRAELYGSLTTAAANPRGDPIREGVIMAYGDVMRILCIVATIFAIPPLLLSLFMPNWYLGDQQNAVEKVDLAGRKIADEDTEGKSAL
ncbi:drug:h+ antiporter [Crepidotus variabilis]|uniref:Drug:h+ antiporter n=1 Tax=Crepidotus variabilis TaxID=179855 RepID=A0A9P6EIY5_9AGAR|nr:drug:h+ antiporter [Crepidotus variabilis]